MVAHVQTKTLVGASGTSGSVTISSTAGNTLVVVADCYRSTNAAYHVSSISDSHNTWTFSTGTSSQNPPVGQSWTGTYTGFTAMGAVVNAAAITSVTVTFSVSLTYFDLIVYEFSGVSSGSSIVIAGASSTLVTASSVTTSSVTVPSGAALAVAAQTNVGNSGSNTTVSSGWTLDSGADKPAAYRLSPSAGSLSATFTSTSSQQWPSTAILVIGTSSVDANVSGVAAEIDITAGSGTIDSGVDVSGVAAEIDIAAGSGVPHASAAITGIAAEVDITGGVGFTPINGNVSGVAAEIDITGGVGIAYGASPDGIVLGTAAQVGVTAGVGNYEADANVNGVAAENDIVGGSGNFDGDASITGIAAEIDTTGGIGSASSGQNITGLSAAVNVTGGIGSLNFGAAIIGVAAEVDIAGGAGVLSGSSVSSFPGSPLGVKIELYLNGIWTDITTYVYVRDDISITDIGRPPESSTIQPGQCTLTLNNRDGRFSPKYAAGAYYPHIQRNTQFRVSILASSSTGFAYNGYRFHGEVSEWPPVADITGTDIYVSITASGIWRRLSRYNTNIGSAYTRYNNNLSGIAGYWPMEDGSGSLDFSPGILGGSVMAFTSGLPNLSATAAFPGSNALPALNGAVLTGTISTSGSHTVNRFRFLVFVPSGGDTGVPASSVIASLHTNGTVARADVLLGAAGGGPFVVKGYNSGGSNIFTVTSSSLQTYGQVNFVEVALVNSGSNVTCTITVYQPNGTSPYASGSGTVSGSVGNATSIVFNSGAAYKGTVAGQAIVLYDTSPSLVDAAAALAGYAGETALVRFARICTEEGITYETIGSSSVAMGPQYDGTFPAVLQTIENSDQGLLYEMRDDFGLGYRAYNSMVDQTAVVTIDYSAKMLSAVPSTTYDDQNIVNDVTLNNYDGYSYRLYLASGAMSIQSPPNGVGDYPGSPVNTVLDATGEAAAVAQVAKRILNPGVVDELRIPNLTVNLARSAVAGLFGTIPSVFIGDYIALSNPPSWLSDTNPSKQIAIGYSETINNFNWTIVFNTIPEVGYESAFNPGTTVGGRASGAPVTGASAGSVSGADISTGAITTGGLAGYVTSASIGGITTSVGTIAPVDPNTGDIWINESIGYQINRFDGTSWIPITFTGTDVIEAGTINASLIEVGTITASLLAAGIVVAGIVNATTITGARIVADGSSGELLVYSATPATGNLVMSASAVSGADGIGNNYDAGIAVYGSNGSKVKLYTSGTSAVLSGVSGAATEAAPTMFSMAVFNSGLGNENIQMQLRGPQSNYDDNSVSLILTSSAADGSSLYSGTLEVGSSAAAIWGPGTLGTQLSVVHQLLIGTGASGGSQVEMTGSIHVGGSIIIGAGSFPIAAPSTAGAPSGTYSSVWASSVTNVLNNLRSQLIAAGILF